MVKTKDGGTQSIAPFLKKCYDMVDDESTNSIISWAQSSDSFIIWDITEFCVQLLPKYFKHNNFSSFIRQLNIYGFRKIDTDRWEFSNDGFVRDQKHLLKNISRRKHTPGSDNLRSTQQETVVESFDKVEKLDLCKEVESLKVDKNVLMQELVKLRQHQETADNTMLILRNRLQGMEKNQQQMLSFLVIVMQYPEFLVQLLQQKESKNNWRMAPPGTILEQDAEDAEPLVPDGMIVRYTPSSPELVKSVRVSEMDFETQQEQNLPSGGANDFFLSPEFVKVLYEESFFPLEDHQDAFLLPELSDDGAWEQFLLANPFLENGDLKQDEKESTGFEIDGGTTQSGASNEKPRSFSDTKEASNGDEVEVLTEKLQSLEYLTQQMGMLASETNHEDL